MPPPFLLDQPRNNPPGRTSASINSTNISAPAVTEARTGHRRTGSAAFPQAAMRISMASFTADERGRHGPKQRLPTSAHFCKECGISNLSVIAEYERKTGDGLSPGLTFFDVNGKARKFPQTFADNVALRSHGKRTAIWNSPQAHQFLQPLMMARSGWTTALTHAV